MEPGYIDLELDAVEARGAGRVPQETAKSPATPGSGILSSHPEGIPRQLIKKKGIKTRKYVGTEKTQVLRREQG